MIPYDPAGADSPSAIIVRMNNQTPKVLGSDIGIEGLDPHAVFLPIQLVDEIITSQVLVGSNGQVTTVFNDTPVMKATKIRTFDGVERNTIRVRLNGPRGRSSGKRVCIIDDLVESLFGSKQKEEAS